MSSLWKRLLEVCPRPHHIGPSDWPTFPYKELEEYQAILLAMEYVERSCIAVLVEYTTFDDWEPVLGESGFHKGSPGSEDWFTKRDYRNRKTGKGYTVWWFQNDPYPVCSRQ